ncbi:Serine/threonine-protein phosphatase 2A activator 2 [Dispira simplex]|nr:Serine/threonine-protein phosphatase 2A activator 2 [Dispira simplex]
MAAPTVKPAPSGEPRKVILTKQDLEDFQNSNTYKLYVGFIEELNNAVVGKTLRDDCLQTPFVAKLLSLLEDISDVIKATPPEKTDGRFGNPAFRVFYDKVKANIPKWVGNLLEPTDDSSAEEGQQVPTTIVSEIGRYLLESFGNRQRIDYGTGHEANFMAFLLCLDQLGRLTLADYPALVLRVFYRYLLLMRQLQFAYWLEPAGSHGVWGLDDYHFLPFMFGSAQLRGHKYIKPKSIHTQETVQEFAKDYMYLACIQFINKVKTASLRWHSPMLDDISGVKSWDKVNSGMLKMYRAEVLGKLPIMQHFMFGTLIPFEPHRLEQDNVEPVEAESTVPNATPIMPTASPHAPPPTTYAGRPLIKGEDGHTYTLVNGKKIRLNVGSTPCQHAGTTGEHGAGDPLAHVHAQGQEFPTCCGMRIPSAIGAARQHDGHESYDGEMDYSSHRIPFD